MNWRLCSKRKMAFANERHGRPGEGGEGEGGGDQARKTGRRSVVVVVVVHTRSACASGTSMLTPGRPLGTRHDITDT